VLVTSASVGWLIAEGLTDPDGLLGLPIGPLIGILAGMAGLGVIGTSRAGRGTFSHLRRWQSRD
jgi:hypothetical protein